MNKLCLLLTCIAVVASVMSTSAGENEIKLTECGAVGDGITLNTKVIQLAIDRCTAMGGGTVIVPQGVFLTGAVFLKCGVNLHLDKDSVLRGSTNIADYPEMQTRIEGHIQIWVPALINANGVDHLRIDGDGIIQGGGKIFWDEFLRQRKANKETKNLDVKRPRSIFIQDSNDVQLRGISIRDSGFWNLHLFRCQNVLIEKMDIRTPLGAPSTDGIDLDCCQNVTIQDCFISVDDDNIALKGSKGPSAVDEKATPPVENIRISGCTFGLGNASLTFGSEATMVRYVVMENCRLTGEEKNCLLSIKLRQDTEQCYENITVRNIKIDNPRARLISLAPWTQYFDLQGKPAPSQKVANVTLSEILGKLSDFGVIKVMGESTIKNVSFKNIDITLGTPAVVPKNVDGLKYDNVKINGVSYTGDQLKIDR